MGTFGFDPDASMQDADIEMAQFADAADRLARIERAGTCTHGWHERLPDGRYQCKRCGQTWASEAEAFAAHDQYL